MHALSNTPALFRVRVEGEDLRQADDVARAIAAKYTPQEPASVHVSSKRKGRFEDFFFLLVFFSILFDNTFNLSSSIIITFTLKEGVRERQAAIHAIQTDIEGGTFHLANFTVLSASVLYAGE